MGGILFSLVLTLFVIPAAYTMFSVRKERADSDEETPQQREDLVYEA
jgi:hypothetical protein